MLMVFAQRMEMILRGPIGPHTVLWGLNSCYLMSLSLHHKRAFRRMRLQMDVHLYSNIETPQVNNIL